jgi:hypothetical protein
MSRQKRTTNIRKKVLCKWSQIYWEFILENEDKELDWLDISQNPNITMDIIESNPYKEWDWESISDRK